MSRIINASQATGVAHAQVHATIAPPKKTVMAYNSLPLYYRTHASSVLAFELIDEECEVLSGMTMFHAPGRSVGHMAVGVETSAGEILVSGDAIFQAPDLEPSEKEGWRYWAPARFVNPGEGRPGVGEIDKRTNGPSPCHDEACGGHKLLPFRGARLRERRWHIPGCVSCFGDMPPGAARKAAR